MRIEHSITHSAEEFDAAMAAEALRIPLSTLNQKIKRLNIEIRKRGG